jgi:hypothetical protein
MGFNSGFKGLNFNFGFPLSAPFNQCTTPTFISVLPLPEGQTGDEFGPSNK